MSERRSILSRAGRWYERTRRPGMALAGLIVVGYGWTIGWGPMIDDFRLLRVMRNYHESRRSELGLYLFLEGGVENRLLRTAGYYPWWVGDDVRYRHARPLSERWLYGQYLLFGELTTGYRAVSLAMYAAGALIVLRLFRLVLADERLARWAALIFTVAASHAVAVGFISMQCDLLGLLLIAGAMCLAVRFVRDGGAVMLAGGCALYALALGAKESSLPAAVLPILTAWASGRDAAARKRGIAATGMMLTIGAAWLAMYAVGGYGANNSMMLDPLRAPGYYLAELWTRAGVLLSTWLIPINPFLFYLRPAGERVIPVLACVGLVTLALFAWLVARHGRRAAMWAIWAMAFMPLLVCTPPDDRNLMLPSIGLAALAATWLAGRERLCKLPLVLFVVLQIPAAGAVLGALRHVSTNPLRTLEAGLAALERSTERVGHLFFVNAWDDGQLLFTRDCMDYLLRRQPRSNGVRVAYLCDIREPRVTRVDERTLRIEGVSENLLAGFVGKMGRARGHRLAVGDEYDAGEFVAKIVAMHEGQIAAVEFRFKRSLDDPAYRFLRCGPGGSTETAFPAT